MRRLWVVCILVCALRSSGQHFIAPRPDAAGDQEPVIIVNRLPDGDRVITAWMQRPDADVKQALVHVSSSKTLSTWNTKVLTGTLEETNEPYPFSGDPFLSLTDPNDPNGAYVVVHTREYSDSDPAIVHAGGENEIALWKTTNGGVTWTDYDGTSDARTTVCAYDRVDWDGDGVRERPAFLTDKPSVAPGAGGTVYVAHLLFDRRPEPDCIAGGNNVPCPVKIHVHRGDASGWKVSEVPTGLQAGGGGRAHSPIVLVSPQNGDVYVTWLGKQSASSADSIFMVSSKAEAWTTQWNGSPFQEASRTSVGTDHLLLPNDFIRGWPSRKVMGAASMVMARFNDKANPPSIGIVWHDRKTVSTAAACTQAPECTSDPCEEANATTDVKFVRFTLPDGSGLNPFGTFGSPTNVTEGTPAVNQWNPALHFDDGGNYAVMYYESAASDRADYDLKVARLQPDGTRFPGTAHTLTTTASLGSKYKRNTLGEYQDLWYLDGVWYGATILAESECPSSCDCACNRAPQCLTADAYVTRFSFDEGCAVPSNSFYIQLRGSNCQLSATPEIRKPPGSLLYLSPIPREHGTDATLLANGFDYEWMDGPTVLSTSWQLLNHPVPLAGAEELTLNARRRSDGTCDSILVRIVPEGEACTGCVVPGCKRRAVTPRTNEIPRGESVELEAPVEPTPVVYTWYSAVGSEEPAPIPNSNNQRVITLYPQVSTTYWTGVDDGEFEMSEPATVTVWHADIQPEFQSISSGANAVLEVVVSPNPGNYDGYTFEWHAGEEDTAPVMPDQTGRFLIKSLTASGSFWCRVTTPNNMVLKTPVARVAVSCDSIAGTASVWPNPHGYFSVYDKPWVQTSAEARVGAGAYTYAWRERYRGDTWHSVAGGRTAWASEGHDWAAYEVLVSDTCGQEATIGPVVVRNCIPAIDDQPQDRIVRNNETATLAVVAVPALWSQTLRIRWYAASDVNATTPLYEGASFVTPQIAAGTSRTYYATVSADCYVDEYSTEPRYVRSRDVVVTGCINAAITATSASPAYIRAGQAAAFSVSVTGSNLTYQWYTGLPGDVSAPIADATDALLVVTPSSTTTYWVRVFTDGVCYIDSTPFVADVCSNPVISVQPAPVKVDAGSTATLSVAATPAEVTYQWFDVATADPIDGATSASFTFTPSADGQYFVKVTRDACTVTSTTATVTVCALSTSLSATRTQLKYGEWTTLTANTTNARVDDASLYYTWYRSGANGVEVFNAGAGLRERADHPETTTQYWVTVSDGTCSVTSPVVTVNVCIPQITSQPQPALIAPNTTATLTIETTNIVGQTIKWYEGAAGDTTKPVAGATSKTMTTPQMTATKSYWARVTGTCSSYADSQPATVTVCSTPSISVTPARSIRRGSSTSHTVTATGNNLTYQWYVGTPGNTSSPIAGATSATYSMAPLVTTTYWARVVSDGLCPANSAAMVVDVCTDPEITTPPASVTIKSGSSTTLSVTSPTTGVTYQWYLGNGAAILGATSSTLNVTPPADTQYYVRLSRSVCSSTTAPATVTVCSLSAILPATYQRAAGQSTTITASVTNGRVANSSSYYKWYYGTGASSVLFAEGTGMTQRTVNPTVTTQYWVRVSDGTCTADSNVATVQVCAPTITSQPQNASINSGQSVLLSVSATGAPLSYQWYIGSPGVTTNLIGSGPSITVTPAATTTYWVRVIGCSSVDSAAATVSVCVPPAVTSGPVANPTSYPGTAAYVSLSSSGTNVSYQWYVGQSGDTSQPIAGATGARYDFTASVSRYYWARLTGSCGTANSAAILHSVVPKITQQPAGTVVPPNGTAVLSMTATGTYLSYQWYRGTTGILTYPITGATTNVLTTPPITAATSFWCKVTSGQAFEYSNHATVSLCTGPAINSARSRYVGGTWWLQVYVSNADIGRVEYHYYTGVPGNVAQSVYKAEGPAANQINVTAAETWWCRVWYADNSCYTDTNGMHVHPVQ